MLPVSPQVIVQPDDGVQPVLDFIASAQRSLLIKQFAFTEPSVVAAGTGPMIPVAPGSPRSIPLSWSPRRG
jgi:hypothetical protein